MRVAVIFFSGNNRERVLNLSRALARGVESQGHQVDIVDGNHDINTKLTIYRYIAVGTEQISTLGRKIPRQVSQFLSSSGMVSGKRCFAFVPKNLFGAGKALSRLMKGMEKEGMYLKNSAIFTSPQEAEEVGKRLHIS